MKDYQRTAIESVRKKAQENNREAQVYLASICGPFGIEVDYLIESVLQSPVTINFHPDRFSNNGKIILESLLEEGLYHSQFRTGTTNGGKTAFMGGERYLWEQRLFFNAYPDRCVDRPKYGALNVLKYIDGASVRFGSCYFTLHNKVTDRCTFSYGDSVINPTVLCTSDTFACILAELFRDVHSAKRLLNLAIAEDCEALAVLLNKDKELRIIGKNLDYCIETHIHGEISLASDVDCLYMDQSYEGTEMEQIAVALCSKYDIDLKWIPERRIQVEALDHFFRGPMIPLIAKKIDALFGDESGFINARILGKASRDSAQNPLNWSELGTQSEVFQYIKQLWHTIGYFG